MTRRRRSLLHLADPVPAESGPAWLPNRYPNTRCGVKLSNPPAGIMWVSSEFADTNIWSPGVLDDLEWCPECADSPDVSSG